MLWSLAYNFIIVFHVCLLSTGASCISLYIDDDDDITCDNRTRTNSHSKHDGENTCNIQVPLVHVCDICNT